MSIDIQERIATKDELKVPPRFNIWAINNDFTSWDEVVFILTRALGMSESVASELTNKIDKEGKAKLNPKPMTKDIAEAYLAKVNETKRTLASMNPFRANQVMMLKFIVKED
jgi:ATP-dependent Clp protease adapter protein ClpS